MRFLFVDQITAQGDQSIEGRRAFTDTAPMQYQDPQGERQIAPGVISEGVGQLVSWLCLHKNDFKARPVFLFADSINILKPVRPGAVVNMSATIDDWQV